MELYIDLWTKSLQTEINLLTDLFHRRDICFHYVINFMINNYHN